MPRTDPDDRPAEREGAEDYSDTPVTDTERTASTRPVGGARPPGELDEEREEQPATAETREPPD
jgi:hypothetical protein